MIAPLAQAAAAAAAAPAPSPLTHAAGRVYRNGAWRNPQRRRTTVGGHRDPIETGAFGPTTVGGGGGGHASPQAGSGSSGGVATSSLLPMLLGGNFS